FSHHQFEVITSRLFVRKHLCLRSLAFVIHAERAPAGFLRTEAVGAVLAGSRLISLGSASYSDFNPFCRLSILGETSKDVACQGKDVPRQGENGPHCHKA